jgi:hypothetical protein
MHPRVRGCVVKDGAQEEGRGMRALLRGCREAHDDAPDCGLGLRATRVRHHEQHDSDLANKIGGKGTGGLLWPSSTCGKLAMLKYVT